MSKRSRKAKSGPRAAQPAPQGASLTELIERPGVIAALIAFAVIVFYFTPLFDGAASIQWDAADVHYTAQKYFSDAVRVGRLPFWSGALFSGMPFLADPQTGAWYPLNWPFFLVGIGPKSIEWELALHCFLAFWGAYLLSKDLLGSRAAGLFAGVFYGFSGFFAAHSSHVGIFQTAALLPWLLYTTRRACLPENRLRWLLAGGGTGACVVLAGHFQSALYAFFALALFLLVDQAVQRGGRIREAAVALVAVAALAALGSVIAWLPGLELAEQSIRAGADYSKTTNAPLVAGALGTLIFPNHYGAATGPYHGPPDVTQFYFYAGFLLLPLAIAGVFVSHVRWYALVLILPCLWYAFGPAGGFYLLLARLPGFRSVRAPVHIWFVIALGLALLAAAGVQALRLRFNQRWVVAVLLVIACGDAWHWNMSENVLAYGRFEFQARYGVFYDQLSQAVAPFQTPPYRIWSPSGIGALNSSLVYPAEVTFGYNPLELSRYSSYINTANANPRLLNSLSVTAKAGTAGIAPNPSALPRAFFPSRVTVVNRAQATARLLRLDPVAETLVENPNETLAQDSQASARVMNYEESRYRIHYRASSKSLMRMAIPFFPGWHAQCEGNELRSLPADLALTGIVVPAGEHDVDVSYSSTWFPAASSLTALAWLGGLAAIVMTSRRS
jgi:hypothetical protein